ncbi:MAG: response regulator [Anaerolineae bacterium]
MNMQLPQNLIQTPAQSRDLRKTKELPAPDDGYKNYPPSVLIVTDRPNHAGKLSKELENNGCQVSWSDTSPANLASVCHRYYDVIVLDIKPSDWDGVEVHQNIKACPQLAGVPVVVLDTPKTQHEPINLFSRRPVYHLPRDNSIAAKLLQIVSQIHYLTYRYLPILT